MLSASLCGVARVLSSTKGRTTPHNSRRSERLEPLEDGAVGSPGSDRGVDGPYRARLSDRGTFRREVDGSVPVRSLNAGVTEPMADCDEVDARLEKVNGCGVTEYVCLLYTSPSPRD